MIDIEKEGLVLLCEALDALGDQYGLYAYSGQGRAWIEFLTIKDFDDRLGAATAHRLGGLAPRHQNRDGAAIRHATAKLLAREAKNRILVLLSDGRPLDDQYKDEYSLEDTKAALREARERGVETFCVTIDREAENYLRRMYADVQYCVIDHVDALPTNLPGYAVERALAPDGPFVRIAVLASNAETAFVDAAAGADGAAFYYRVRAFAPSGGLAAASSEIASATTARAPAPPTGFPAYSRHPRSVPLAWEPSRAPGVGGYVVERSPSAGGPFERLVRLEGRHACVYVDRELGDLRVFYYRVAAVNRAGGVGPVSDAIRAVTKPDPLPPAGLRLAGQRLGANRIEWEPNVETDIVAYRVYRLHEGGRVLLAEVPASQTWAEDPGVGAAERAAYSAIASDRDERILSRSYQPPLIRVVGLVSV